VFISLFLCALFLLFRRRNISEETRERELKSIAGGIDKNVFAQGAAYTLDIPKENAHVPVIEEGEKDENAHVPFIEEREEREERNVVIESETVALLLTFSQCDAEPSSAATSSHLSLSLSPDCRTLRLSVYLRAEGDEGGEGREERKERQWREIGGVQPLFEVGTAQGAFTSLQCDVASLQTGGGPGMGRSGLQGRVVKGVAVRMACGARGRNEVGYEVEWHAGVADESDSRSAAKHFLRWGMRLSRVQERAPHPL
jgi:hypothetical protein